MRGQTEKYAKQVKLSKRLLSVAQMVTPGGCVCDVGCDHGFVSVYLIQEGLAAHVIAVDVREGPLSRAREHVKAYGKTDYIELRLSDGLSAVKTEDAADLAIMAGMGGFLMTRIMDAALKRGLRIPEYVLQPQSHWQQLRAFLRENGYRILQEDMVLEEGKFYPVIKAADIRSADGCTPADVCDKEANQAYHRIYERELEDTFGPILLREKNAVLAQYLVGQEQKFSAVRQQMKERGQASRQVEHKLRMLQGALRYYDEQDLGKH